jgi:hypothetical protein
MISLIHNFFNFLICDYLYIFTHYIKLFSFIYHVEWNTLRIGLWPNWRNVIVFGLHTGFISNTINLWQNLIVVMDAVWSVMKSMTKLAQCHSVWTSYRASYPTLPIYDEIWVFVMDVVWSVTKSENVMGISSWIKGFLVVEPSEPSEFRWAAASPWPRTTLQRFLPFQGPNRNLRAYVWIFETFHVTGW